MTTNVQLADYLKYKKTIAPFQGVHCSSGLPDLPKDKPFCMIVNYDPCSKQGSHWCALAYKHGKCYWFDSYGLKPDASDKLLSDKTDFKGYLNKYSSEILYNHIDLQDIKTSVCGLYSVYFCLYGLPAQNKDKWARFGKSTKKNDEIIKELVPIPMFVE